MKKLLVLTLAAIMAAVFCAGALADITIDEARQIALERAGAKAEDAVFTKAHQELDDGRAVIELEFYVGATEYDMDVDVQTGEISDYEMEAHGLVDAGGSISLEAAKGIALAKLGMKEADVRFTKADKDTDDGRTVYEIEFVAGGMEYEFDIDAATGTILKFDKDVDD